MGNDISKGTGRATGRVVDGRAGWDADTIDSVSPSN